MKDIDLEELEQLAKDATPGTWSWEQNVPPAGEYYKPCVYKGRMYTGKRSIPLATLNIGAYAGEKNAAYIVAACNAVPKLIERVRELERQRDYLALLLEAFCEWGGITGTCPVFHCCPAGRLGCSCGELMAKDWIAEVEEATKVEAEMEQGGRKDVR